MIKKWVGIFCFIFMMVTTVVWAKPDSAYIDNENGTVTDIETKLMWQQATAGPMNFTDALSYCPGLSLAGYKDWQLPTLDELKTLVDRSGGYPTINRTYFPNTVSYYYWSSTDTGKYQTDSAWVVNFGGYGIYFDEKDRSSYVRAVRGAQPGSLGNLVISPSNQSVAKDAGSITFSVSNTGTSIIPWRAAVTAGADWLSISSGAGGTDTGTITCAYTANTSTSSRTGTIQVRAYGDGTSTKDVTVTQNPPGPPTACTATITTTIDGNLLLHIPNLLSVFWIWADLVNVFNYENPTLILFKWTNFGVIENPSFSCEASTLSGNPKTIHIPDVLLPDKITRLWVDLEYSPALSTDGNNYYEAKNYGIVFSN
jgi:hypothetical protein